MASSPSPRAGVEETSVSPQTQQDESAESPLSRECLQHCVFVLSDMNDKLMKVIDTTGTLIKDVIEDSKEIGVLEKWSDLHMSTSKTLSMLREFLWDHGMIKVTLDSLRKRKETDGTSAAQAEPNESQLE